MQAQRFPLGIAPVRGFWQTRRKASGPRQNGGNGGRIAVMSIKVQGQYYYLRLSQEVFYPNEADLGWNGVSVNAPNSPDSVIVYSNPFELVYHDSQGPHPCTEIDRYQTSADQWRIRYRF